MATDLSEMIRSQAAALNTQRQVGYQTGYERGYQQGYNDALRQAVAQLDEALKAPVVVPK